MVYPSEKESTPLLPAAFPHHSRFALDKQSHIHRVSRIFAWTCVFCTAFYFLVTWPVNRLPYRIGAFYSTRIRPVGLCEGVDGKGDSYAGYIGLKGDTKDTPKRSFYWLFEAQTGAKDAPVIMTIGGGPGTSGMLNPLFGQSHCAITSNGSTIPNPNAWSEHFNLLALDHPVGVGFSYGTHVNTSRDAGKDVYDFLQKFYVVYPGLAKNKFVLAGGSYGGNYIPHIATVINEENKKLARGEGQTGAIHINLESMMVSNPLSDFLTHNQWMLQQRCYNTPLYNATQCTELFSLLPACLEGIQFAYEYDSVLTRAKVWDKCVPIWSGDTHGRSLQNYKIKCDGDIDTCFPSFVWTVDFMNSNRTKKALGVPEEISFRSISTVVNEEFMLTGDMVHPTYRLYEQLLEDGIRLLHYVGKLDCNCGWPGVLSFLKLLKSPFQQDFLEAPDVPWPTTDIATVRAIGPGAGNLTWLLMSEAGHLVTMDQPALVKNIVEHWVENRPFV